MNGENQRYNRHSIRLKGYDYSEEGAYFITLVTHHREYLFGNVVDGEMQLNEMGWIVKTSWNDLQNHNKYIELDEFIIMPNHVHGIIIIDTPVGVGSKPTPEYFYKSSSSDKNRPFRAGHGPAPTTGLFEIVRQLKTFSSKRINECRGTPCISVWQRSYYDHIIRSEKDYNNIANYIAMNPSNWIKDDEYLK
jgi:putative transposase